MNEGPMPGYKFVIQQNSHKLKFRQLIDAVEDAISNNQLNPGDMLPSVNQLMKDCQLSRDTVFKAYNDLKTRGVVEAVPNRGYFVARKITRILLFLDTFKAYKEVLYHAFRDQLRKDIKVDLHFHHYNIRVFENILKESSGKYSSYIVMNFDHPKVPQIIGRIPQDKLLVIDWNIHSPENASYVAQDFGEPVYQCLQQSLEKIRKYKRFVFYYPPFTYHPREAIDYFLKFVRDYHISHHVIENPENFKVEKGDLFFLVSDRTLALFLDQCSENGWIIGRDAGVISYNETPMKKYVKDGITVISTDFVMLGKKAAEFANSPQPVQCYVPTIMHYRSSL
jgi:DNA-binding transcriptional regulator YhcF (GntR family)